MREDYSVRVAGIRPGERFRRRAAAARHAAAGSRRSRPIPAPASVQIVALGRGERGVIQRAIAHDDEVRPRFRRAEQLRAAGRAETPVHDVAAVGNAAVIARARLRW